MGTTLVILIAVLSQSTSNKHHRRTEKDPGRTRHYVACFPSDTTFMISCLDFLCLARSLRTEVYKDLLKKAAVYLVELDLVSG